MGFGKTSGTNPVFFEGQKDVAAQAIQQRIVPKIFSGAPDYLSEQTAARRYEDVTRSAATAGFSAQDPVTQARYAQVDAAKVSSEEQMVLQWLNQVMSPAGQAGGGGWQFSLT